jgi:hypothetical protein
MDGINGALIECVRACGGSKQVGPLLWPEKTPEAAQRLILACLNEDRPERLSPEQLAFVLRLAKDRGCHAGMYALCDLVGYSQPTPVEPRDEVAELQRQFIQATEAMQALVARMESLTSHSALRSAA